MAAFSYEQQAAETYFRNTHHLDPDGRYVVCVPFREPPLHLGKIREVYLEMGHAEKVPLHEVHRLRENVFYLPMCVSPQSLLA